jgi:hypothetical protein
MRLTKTDKQAFVTAVMNDVPEVDYNEICRKEVTAWCDARMPEEVKAVMKKYPEWINQTYFSTPYGLSNVSIVAPESIYTDGCGEFGTRLHELARLKKLQDEQRGDMKRKVEAMIEPCTTLKQAKERLPEFEKYLPKERTGTGVGNLPAVANVVAALMEAGWPKDKERKA